MKGWHPDCSLQTKLEHRWEKFHGGHPSFLYHWKDFKAMEFNHYHPNPKN